MKSRSHDSDCRATPSLWTHPCRRLLDSSVWGERGGREASEMEVAAEHGGCVSGGAWRWDDTVAQSGGLAPVVTVAPLLSA
jgi:hypothetical protein